MSNLKERYEKLKKLVKMRRDDFCALMDYIEKETYFLTAPASAEYHLCTESGLLEHSCNVAETMLKIKNVLAQDISDESCVIVALLHDLGKAGMPGKPLYIINNSLAKNKKPYLLNNSNLIYLSVPIRSIYLAIPFIKLTEEEIQAIVYHDGQYIDDNTSVATKETRLTLLLQYADNWSCFAIEKENSL